MGATRSGCRAPGRTTRAVSGLALLAALGLLACAPLGGETPPSRFYLLEPLEAPPARADGPQLGIGPIRLAAYLDRPQIVSRRGDHTLELAEFDRWAEPLDESITRVLMEDLGALLETDRVQRHPLRDVGKVDVQLELDVQRFDGPTAGPVEKPSSGMRRGQSVVGSGAVKPNSSV